MNGADGAKDKNSPTVTTGLDSTMSRDASGSTEAALRDRASSRSYGASAASLRGQREEIGEGSSGPGGSGGVLPMGCVLYCYKTYGI